jgi:Tol biopolymer transport system component
LQAENITLAAVQHLEFDGVSFIAFKAWSPDGSRFLFGRSSQDYVLVQFKNGAGTHASFDDLWVANADGTHPRKLANAVNSWAWSPDGHFVAYLAPVKPEGPEGMLYIVDVERPEPNEIAACDLGDMYDVSWLPTDEIVCRQNGIMHAINSDGSTMRQLNEIFSSDPVTFSGEIVPPMFQGYYNISPDGNKIAYYKTNQSPSLWISNLDGTNAFKIEGLLGQSAWSPDGSKLSLWRTKRQRPSRKRLVGD